MNIEPIEGQPGLFRNTQTGEIVNIRDFREGDKYDSIVIPTGTTAAGTEFVFFQDIQFKREIDTNFKTPRKLSAGESMMLDRIGLSVRLSTGGAFPAPVDIKSIVENGFFRLKVNDILQDEGPAIKFPSGYGLYGQTTETSQGIVSIGVPATASAAKLAKKQLLNQNHELDGVLRYDARRWLLIAASGPFTAGDELMRTNVNVGQNAAGTVVTCYLHGMIKAAVSK
jgi:hypothetical protein